MAEFWSLRVSDADRDEFVERLRCATVEGRLDYTELEERVGRALDAHSYGELVKVMFDLPGARPQPPTAPHPPPAKRTVALPVQSRRGRCALVAYALIALASAAWLTQAVAVGVMGVPLLLQILVVVATLCVVLPLVIMGGAAVVAIRHGGESDALLEQYAAGSAPVTANN